MLKILILFSLSLSSFAKDIVYARNIFLHKLDTSQINLNLGYIFHNKDKSFMENTVLDNFLLNNGVNVEHLKAVSYEDEVFNYSISLDFRGVENNLCMLTINPKEDYTKISQSTIDPSYCENLLSIKMYLHMNTSLKWEMIKTYRLLSQFYLSK